MGFHSAPKTPEKKTFWVDSGGLYGDSASCFKYQPRTVLDVNATPQR